MKNKNNRNFLKFPNNIIILFDSYVWRISLPIILVYIVIIPNIKYML